MRNDNKRIAILSRRLFCLKGPSAFILFNFLQQKAFAYNNQDDLRLGSFNIANKLYSDQFSTDLGKILQGAEPLADDIFKLDISEFAENGSIVPFKMAVNHPMNTIEYVKALHLISTLNPNAWVASFVLTPQCGKAEISGRMRLAKTQDVYALAYLSKGQFLISSQKVEVLIGGCGME